MQAGGIRPAAGYHALPTHSTIPNATTTLLFRGAAPVTQMPAGYRVWRLISVAHEEGNLHSFAAILGNDPAIRTYRGGKLPFPDGTVIAALHYGHGPSAENNKAFGDEQSFVPGPP